MSRKRASRRWAWYGAAFGLAVALSDLLLEWRGPKFQPCVHEGIAQNIGYFCGSMLTAALIGAAAGYIRDRFARRTVDAEFLD